MFLTQIYGTVLGGFISYVVMITIVNANRALLVDGNGNASWSGATLQSYNTNATSWALAKYLYKAGGKYEMVPIGLAIGAAAVVIHRIIAYVSPHLVPYPPSPPIPSQAPYTLERAKNRTDPFRCTCTVQTPHRATLALRRQHGAVHPVRGLHSLQRVADVRHLEPGAGRLLCAVLPTQLPATHLPGLLVPRHGRVGRRRAVCALHPVVRRVWRGGPVCAVSDLVGEQRRREL